MFVLRLGWGKHPYHPRIEVAVKPKMLRPRLRRHRGPLGGVTLSVGPLHCIWSKA